MRRGVGRGRTGFLAVLGAAAVSVGCRASEVVPEVTPLAGFHVSREAGRVVAGCRFSDGSRIAQAQLSPHPLRPGETFQLEWIGERGSAVAKVRIGILPPRVAAHEEVRPLEAIDPVGDPRVVWVESTLADGGGSAQLTLPAPWHPRTAVLVAQFLDADGQVIEVVEGPRNHRDEAVLWVAEVLSRPAEIGVPRAKKPPEIDAVLDEEVWTGPSHVLVESIDGEPVGDDTEVRLAWTPEALYVSAHMRDEDVHSPFTHRDERLWEADVFEVFLSANAEGRDYVEMQVSPRNVVFDAFFATYRRGDEAWEAPLRSAASVDGTLDQRGDRDTGWRVELAVSFDELCPRLGIVCPVGPGTRLRANIFRIDRRRRGGAVGTALSPTRASDFHAWSNAAVLVLSR